VNQSGQSDPFLALLCRPHLHFLSTHHQENVYVDSRLSLLMQRPNFGSNPNPPISLIPFPLNNLFSSIQTSSSAYPKFLLANVISSFPQNSYSGSSSTGNLSCPYSYYGFLFPVPFLLYHRDSFNITKPFLFCTICLLFGY
jgi:hypothetical protein